MNRYVVSVKPAKGVSPELTTEDDKLRNGVEGFGYMLVLFDEEGDPVCEAISNVSTYDLARFMLHPESGVGNIIRQAGAIADGMSRAAEIDREHKKIDYKGVIKGILGAINLNDEDEEE